MSSISRFPRWVAVLALLAVASVGVWATQSAGSSNGFELTTGPGGLTLKADHALLRDVLAKLSATTMAKFDVDPSLTERVTVDVSNVTLEKLLEALTPGQALVYEKTAEGYRLTKAQLASRQDAEPVEKEMASPAIERPEPKLDLGPGVLRNSDVPAGRYLSRRAKAVLLQNAIIDTDAARAGRDLNVPEKFRAPKSTEHYIVQFDHPVGAQDEALLEAHGAKVSHYVPNGAYVVQVSPDAVKELRGLNGVALVEPYHPYFKMSRDVLAYEMDLPVEGAASRVREGVFNLMTYRGGAPVDWQALGVEVVRTENVDQREVVKVKCKPEQLADLVRNENVMWVEPDVKRIAMNDLSRQRVRAVALRSLHPTLTGAGVTIGVTDTGIDFVNPGFSVVQSNPTSTNLNTRIQYYEAREGGFTSDGLPGDTDGHGTHVSGTILGNGALSATVLKSPGSGDAPYGTNQFAGIAPAASLVMLEDFNTFSDSEQAQISYSKGARISNNSWGNSVYEYGTMSALWDALVRDANTNAADGNQEYIAFFAAGNSGNGVDDGTGGIPGTIGQPGNAKNVITVGAVEQPRYAKNIMAWNMVSGTNIVRTIYTDRESDSDYQVAWFSSRGPVSSSDPRMKPDIVAPGSFVLSVQSHETMPDDFIDNFPGRDYRDANVNSGTNFAFFSGTSMATPVSAGGGALIYQYFTNTYGRAPSAAMMKAMIVSGARMLHSLRYPFSPFGVEPSRVDQGWGLLDVERSVDGPRAHLSDEMQLFDQTETTPLATDEFYTHQIVVNPGEGNLKIVLAWTDKPGTPGPSRQLVNDLDLFVLAPGGGGYLGNFFDSDGVHSYKETPMTAEFANFFGDAYNNVEVVQIKDAPPGTYTIKVHAFEVPNGPQDFALVVMKGLGIQGRTQGDQVKVAVDSNDFPIVAYSALNPFIISGQRDIFLRRWSGAFGALGDLGQWLRLEDNWFNVRNSAGLTGVSQSLGDSGDPSVAAQGQNIYVAWSEAAQPSDTVTPRRIWLKAYDGSDWVQLANSASGYGVSGTQIYNATKPVVKVLSPGTQQPAVAWLQAVTTGVKPFFALYNGSAWVGLAGSSSTGLPSATAAVNLDMAVDSYGMPVVAWEESIDQRIHVRRWNGSAWADLGNRGNLPYAAKPSLAAGANGDLYLAWEQYPSGLNSNYFVQVFASRYSGGVWSGLAGSTNYPGVSGATNEDLQGYSPAIGYSAINGQVTLGWQSGSNTENGIFVKRFDGFSWNSVGGAGAYPGVARNGGISIGTAIAMDSKGLPFVAFNNNAAKTNEIMTYTIAGDRAPPTFAGLQTAYGGTNGNVQLGWNAAVDDVSTTIIYRIYRSTASVPCGASPACSAGNVFSNLIATVTNALSFNVTGLTNNQIYCFGVRAGDTNGLFENNTVMQSAGPVSGGGDNDADCLNNALEVLAGTEPCMKDTDGDGMEDGWEWTFSTNNPSHPSSTNASYPHLSPIDNGLDNVRTLTPGDGTPENLPDADIDGDGASNFEEYQWWLMNVHTGGFCEAGSPTNLTTKSDPTKYDTDGDGIPDGWEIFNGLNPTDPSDALADPDGDGLNNLQEFQYGSDPRNVDSDGDGLTDGSEVAFIGTSPALADTDGDGLDDGFESAIGSNPKRADSNGSFVNDGDVFQLGMNPTSAVANFRVLLSENFETSSRTNWTHKNVNAAFPHDFWHLSTAEPRPQTNGIIYEYQHTTSTAYRAANDPSKMTATNTYHAGPIQLIMALDSPVLTNAVGVSNLFVAWNEYFETEPNADYVQVQARGGANTNWVNVTDALSGYSGVSALNSTNGQARWQHRIADISQFAGRSNVQVRFLFRADNKNNQYVGWWVDDVAVYEGVTIRGWVRDNNGRAIQGALVSALGRGGVTNVVEGHAYVRPAKVFGQQFTAMDGSYEIKGLPQGFYRVKASGASYIDEFYDGPLFTGSYAFAAGYRPGVTDFESISTNGVLDLTAAGAGASAHFELERGSGRGRLAVLYTNGTAQTVFADGVATRVWNGVATTNGGAFVPYITSNGSTVAVNFPDWETNAIQPSMLWDLAPGVHQIGIGTNLAIVPLPSVSVVEGETTRVAIRTNQAVGRLAVFAADGGHYRIQVDSRLLTNTTPAVLTALAGTHEVSLSSTSLATRVAPKSVIVPIGGRASATFTSNDLGAASGWVDLRTSDVNGNTVTGATIYVNSALIGLNDVVSGLTNTTPTILKGLQPGMHYVTVLKPGYARAARRPVNVVSGVTNVQEIILEQSDEDFDRVGDATEISGYTNIFLYSRSSDPDGDGLSNQMEFDLYRLFNVYVNPFNPDSDADGMRDGAEVGYDGLTNRYALTKLYTNAVSLGSSVKLLFVGQYLAGVDNFGSGTIPLSINGDRIKGTIAHPLLTVPTALPALTVITNIPTFPDSDAISAGHAGEELVFADGRPDVKDTDGDGMWDGYEYDHGLSTLAKLDVIEAGRQLEDPDADGMNNLQEFLGTNGVADFDWTNPNVSDTDNDGMPDGWEWQYGLNPLDPSDAFGDLDGDQLVNVAEFYAGTNPKLADTDADCLPDYEEVVTYHTDPLNPDTDGDGLLDGQEVWDMNCDGVRDGGFFPMWAGGDLDNDGLVDGPTDWDTDGDGMPDGFEVLDAKGNIRPDGQRLNPYDPTDADLDPDGDGLSNLQEYMVRDALFGAPPTSFPLFNAVWYGRPPNPLNGGTFDNMPYAPAYPVWDYSTDPFNPDSDGDGMPDGFEVFGGLHPMDPVMVDSNILVRYGPLSNDGDLDSDGLWNIREYTVRYLENNTFTTSGVIGASTHPWRPDTDGDGLDDGEEFHAFRSNPTTQDTDQDRLWDGSANTNGYGEVESALRHRYALVACTNCTWEDAQAYAELQPSPDDPSVMGHLATLGSAREWDQAVQQIGGVGTNIAIGLYQMAPANAYVNVTGEPLTFQFFFTNLPVPELNSTNGVVMGTDGTYRIVNFTNEVVDHYIVEWEGAPIQTNHFDEALNDLWQLTFPVDAGLGAPYWTLVTPTNTSAIPSPRWGHSMQYVPGYEIKDQVPDHDPHLGPGTHILLDNRKLVVIGGRDGVERDTDIWEYWIKSNAWTRSQQTLVTAGSFAYFAQGLASGVSEFQSALMMGYRNTKLKTCGCNDVSWNCGGIGFGEPKDRPWPNGYKQSSYDKIYILGGWNNEHEYLFPEPMETLTYKSTDDMNDIIEESRAFNNQGGDARSYDVWQAAQGTVTETVDTNGVTNVTVAAGTAVYGDLAFDALPPPDENTGTEDGKLSNNQVPLGGYISPPTTITNDNKIVTIFATNVATAIRIGRYPFKVPCDRVTLAELVFDVVSPGPASDVDLEIVAEFQSPRVPGAPFESYPYTADPYRSPTQRAAGSGFVSSAPISFTIPAGSFGSYTVDVTTLMQEISMQPNWQGYAVGFVITNAAGATDGTLMWENSAFLRIYHQPSYRVPPTWHKSKTVQAEQGEIPSKRKSFGMVYDYIDDRMVVFGGMNGRQVFDETYIGVPGYRGKMTWLRVHPQVSPPARWGHSMVYDDVNNRVLVFGGFDANNQPLNDLWAYTPFGGGDGDGSTGDDDDDVDEDVIMTNIAVGAGTWTQITSFQDTQRPSPRGGAMMVFYGGDFYHRGATDYKIKGKRLKVVLFGGTDGKDYFNDLWYYDESESNYDIDTTNGNRWVLADPGGQQSPGPTPRAFGQIVFAQNAIDTYAKEPPSPTRSAKATVFLFGGRKGTLPTSKDTDHDFVDDGTEYELGGPAAGRDPRVNALYPDTNTTETVPYAYKLIGTWGGALPGWQRPAVADFEALSYHERLHGWRMGVQYAGVFLPWQGFPLETTHNAEYYTMGDESVFPVEEPATNRIVYMTGVEAMDASWTNMWFHRAGLGDPQGPGDVWELGIPDNSIVGPQHAPPYAYSGRWVYGTKLNGNYPRDSQMELYSPIFDLTLPNKNDTSTNNMNSFFLVFHEWLDLADQNDQVRVDLVRPSTPADVVTRVSGLTRPTIPLLPNRNNSANTTGTWRRVIVPLNAAGNESNLYVRFTLQSDTNALVAGGWYLDDVAILQGAELSGYLAAPGAEICLIGENFNEHNQDCTTVNSNNFFQFGLLPLGNYQLVSAGATNGPYALSDTNIVVTLAPPPSPLAPPEFTAIGKTPVVVTWTATNGAVYRLDFTTNLMGGVWTPMTVLTGGIPPTLTYTDLFSTADRIYRVSITNAP